MTLHLTPCVVNIIFRIACDFSCPLCILLTTENDITQLFIMVRWFLEPIFDLGEVKVLKFSRSNIFWLYFVSLSISIFVKDLNLFCFMKFKEFDGCLLFELTSKLQIDLFLPMFERLTVASVKKIDLPIIIFLGRWLATQLFFWPQERLI